MGSSKQEYWSGLPCLPPGDLPDPGIKPKPVSLHVHLQGIFLTQASNLGLLHCRQILYRLSHQGSPEKVGTNHSESEAPHSGSPCSALPCVNPALYECLTSLAPHASRCSLRLRHFSSESNVGNSQAGFSVPACYSHGSTHTLGCWEEGLELLPGCVP